MLKITFFGAASALALSALVVGPSTTGAHLGVWREATRDVFDSWMPDAHQAAVIRNLIEQMEGDIQNHQEALDDVDIRIQEETEDLETVKFRMGKEKEYLAQAQELLATRDTTFSIGGRTYTRESVHADARSRVKICEDTTQEVTNREQIVASLEASRQQGQADLERARRVVAQKRQELEALEIRLANADVRRQVDDLTAKLRQSGLQGETELGEAFRRFKQRVRHGERKAQGRERAGRNGLIDWAKGQDDLADTMGRIAKVLGPGQDEIDEVHRVTATQVR